MYTLCIQVPHEKIVGLHLNKKINKKIFKKNANVLHMLGKTVFGDDHMLVKMCNDLKFQWLKYNSRHGSDYWSGLTIINSNKNRFFSNFFFFYTNETHEIQTCITIIS